MLVLWLCGPFIRFSTTLELTLIHMTERDLQTQRVGILNIRSLVREVSGFLDHVLFFYFSPSTKIKSTSLVLKTKQSNSVSPLPQFYSPDVANLPSAHSMFVYAAKFISKIEGT